MIFNVQSSGTKRTVELTSVPAGRTLVLDIIPESVLEIIESNIDSIQLINSQLPRQVFSGIKERKISFSAILHGLAPKRQQESSNKNLKDELGYKINTNIVKGITTLVPFSANLVRGINTIADLTGLTAQISSYTTDNKTYRSTDVELSIKDLLDLQAGNKNTLPAKKIRISGYDQFFGIDFYISSVQINRKFWDKKLAAQFAEVSITLIQIGTNDKVGKISIDGN